MPRIVITPVNNWVNPRSRPSANVSTSATTRLIISPWECPSRYLRGTFWILSKAFSRISSIILYTIWLLHRLIIHWAAAVRRITTPIFTRSCLSIYHQSKLLSTVSRNDGRKCNRTSTASPVRIGRYNVNTTETAAIRIAAMSQKR